MKNTDEVKVHENSTDNRRARGIGEHVPWHGEAGAILHSVENGASDHGLVNEIENGRRACTTDGR